MTRRLLTLDEAAEYLGLSPHTLRRMVARREIPFVKTTDAQNARLLFDVRDLDRWIEARKTPARETVA